LKIKLYFNIFPKKRFLKDNLLKDTKLEYLENKKTLCILKPLKNAIFSVYNSWFANIPKTFASDQRRISQSFGHLRTTQTG